jgi:hypothetical protein
VLIGNVFFLSAIPGIRITLPRTRSTLSTIARPRYVNASSLSGLKPLHLPMVHLIPVPKADSTITIEITPIKDYGHNLTLLLRYSNFFLSRHSRDNLMRFCWYLYDFIV